LHHRVPSRALPIHFFRHLLYAVPYRLATAIGHKTDRNQKQTSVWNCKLVNIHADHGYAIQRYVLGLHYRVKKPKHFCHFTDTLKCLYSYTVRCTQYDRLSQQQLSFV